MVVPEGPCVVPPGGRTASTGAASRARPGRYFGPTRPSGPYTPRYGSRKPCSRRQLTTWAVTAESFACHDCPRRHAAPSSSGHGRSPGDHPSWLGLRPRRQLRQRATEGRPRQRRRATRTPPRHGTAATCALASFLVVVVQRGGRRFESCSYRQGGQCLVGRSPSPDTLLLLHFHPALASLAFRQPVRAISAPRVMVGMVLCALARAEGLSVSVPAVAR
jgi:hypothetical protein